MSNFTPALLDSRCLVYYIIYRATVTSNKETKQYQGSKQF